MFRTLLFFYFLLASCLALAAEKDTRSCAQRTREALGREALSGVVTSVGERSLYTLAWRGRELYRLADHSDRIGKIFQPLSHLERIPFPAGAWKNISLVAVQSDAYSVMNWRAIVALADNDGSLFVFDTDEGQPARLPYREGRFLVSLALTKGEATQLTLFSNQGIETFELPARLDHEVRLAPQLAYPVAGIKGGIALDRDDFVAFSREGVITRYHEGRAEIVGKAPRGVRSLGGYLTHGKMRLWLLDEDGALWSKKKQNGRFERCAFQLPPGVEGVRISASSKIVDPETPFFEQWSGGYFSRSNFSWKLGTQIERVIITGNDGRAYSPFPETEEQQELWPVRLHPDLLAAAGFDFGIDITSLLRGSTLTPGEVRLKMNQLEQARELSAGQEKPLSTTDQRLLLRTWFTHLLHERYLDTAGSGIEETLSRIGVPKQRAARLIFLACLGFQDVESLLLQRDLDRNMEYFQEINRLLLLSGHAFRQQYARSREGRQLVENFALKARTFLHGERDRFLDQILDAPWADQPIYLAMDAFFSQRTYLWHWNLESEIADNANPPGPKGTTGGASAE